MKIETIKSKGFAVSVMLFPLMLLAGFLMHPDLLEMKMLHTAQRFLSTKAMKRLR